MGDFFRLRDRGDQFIKCVSNYLSILVHPLSPQSAGVKLFWSLFSV
jgi:hypothetical protein